MRDITITKVMNGYSVRVGCQTLVFESTDRMLKEIHAYCLHPDQVEQAYIQRFGLQQGPGAPIPSNAATASEGLGGISQAIFTPPDAASNDASDIRAGRSWVGR